LPGAIAVELCAAIVIRLVGWLDLVPTGGNEMLDNEIDNEMLEGLKTMFSSSPSAVTARTIIDAQRATIFRPYALRASTIAIDVTSACLQELEDAIADCNMCFAVEYPETAEGCDRAADIRLACYRAIAERYSKHGTTIMKNIYDRIGRPSLPE
jgi:hypothetical protein